MQLRAKLTDFELGIPLAIIHRNDAALIGVRAGGRVEVSYNKNTSTYFVELTDSLVAPGEIGLTKKSAIQGIREWVVVNVAVGMRPKSIDFIKKKLDNDELTRQEIRAIIEDVYHNRLTDIELSSLLAAVYINELTDAETVELTKAMVDYGEVLDWGYSNVVDKHCVGGIPGNRTTPIVVAIVAAAGLPIPKTSSRAITSPAGTADTMEVFCDVSFSIPEIKKIVKKTNGCFIWGGSLALAPVDDKLIRIEHPLSLDPPAQVIASVLAKKKSAGSKYVVIDIPVGKYAKFEDIDDAKALATKFKQVGRKLGMHVECLLTDGNQPVGNGVGPVPEAIDIVNVLKGEGPEDLREKCIDLATSILQMTKKGNRKMAQDILDSGKAYAKFKEIVEMQRGSVDKNYFDMLGKQAKTIYAKRSGTVLSINNFGISTIAKKAGAPKDRGAGIYLHAKVGTTIKKGEKLYEIYADKDFRLKDAVLFAEKNPPFMIGSPNSLIIETI